MISPESSFLNIFLVHSDLVVPRTQVNFVKYLAACNSSKSSSIIGIGGLSFIVVWFKLNSRCISSKIHDASLLRSLGISMDYCLALLPKNSIGLPQFSLVHFFDIEDNDKEVHLLVRLIYQGNFVIVAPRWGSPFGSWNMSKKPLINSFISIDWINGPFFASFCDCASFLIYFEPKLMAWSCRN